MLKLERFLFYLLIFCLPFQARKIIYQFGGGDFNEWTSIYVYLTDILLLSVFLLFIWRKKEERFLKHSFKIVQLKSYGFWLFLFLIISFLSLIQARVFFLGFYSCFKLLEMIGLFFYLKYNLKKLFNFEKIAYIFVWSGLFQSFISIGQYIQQKSLGLTILKESLLNVNIAGVAKIVIDGTKIVRPYGTFPHPNVLAVFLFICIFFIYFLFLKKEKSFKNYIFLLISFFSIFFALFITYSRLVIFAFLFSSIIYFIILFRNNKKQVLGLFFLFLICLFLFSFLAWSEISSRLDISMGDQSIGLRLFYNQTAFFIIEEYPLLGIGMGNFVWEIKEMLYLLESWVYQPVHNIYLLITSETGLIGLFLFLMFIYQLLRRFNKESRDKKGYLLFLIILSFMFLGLFDHFFWTLQQGQLMFWLILGLMAGYFFGKEKAPVKTKNLN